MTKDADCEETARICTFGGAEGIGQHEVFGHGCILQLFSRQT